MVSARITHLRYVGIASPDAAKAGDFYGGVWGLKKVEGEGGVSYFAAEGSPEQFVLRVREAPERRVDIVSFAVENAAQVDALASELAVSGVRFASEPGALTGPGGGYGFRFFDPDGRVVEISSDVATRDYRDIEAKDPTPRKLSHIVLTSTDVKATTAWYIEKLGFRLSDWIGEFFAFLRCNPDYHSLAFVQGKDAALHHISYETRGIDEVMRAMGKALKADVPLQHGPGYYGNAQMAFAYFYDPSGYVTEYASPQLQIEDDAVWKPKVWGANETEQWGISRGGENIPPNAERELDPGLWVAPPV